MATVYVIHDPADRPFVTSTLLKPLPSLGFDRWIPSERDAATVIEACAATMVLVSQASRGSDLVRRAAARALHARQPLVPIRLDETDPDEVAPGLGLLSTIDLSARAPADERTACVRARLPESLPSVAETSDDAGDLTAGDGLAIEWNEEVFSEYLRQSVVRHDFSRGELLLHSLGRHLARRPWPYAAVHAQVDLGTLRGKRQFRLMGRYAEMVLASGTDDPQVRRQLAQSLIERGQFDDARLRLQDLAESTPSDHPEHVEALGLLGRLFKQQYVNEPEHPEAPARLRRAFDCYFSVYRDDADNVWHGVNAASLLLRGARDGQSWASPDQGRAIAAAILEQLHQLEKQGGLKVWDRASRVEMLIALERVDEAAEALDAYLADPAMDAFEVSSTFRQFDEVLQLAARPEGRAIHEKLLRAVDRYRAGGATSSPAQRDDPAPAAGLPILIRVSDPAWRTDIPGLVISPRPGTVLSARATRGAIHALLKDPQVIALEESRPVVESEECARGLPFIKVAPTYADGGGTFEEKGRHALIAFVDNGIDVLHKAFTAEDGTTTRIVGIWDQRDASGPAPPGFDYGRYYSHEEVQGFVSGDKAIPSSLGRNDIGPPGALGHGTHVASIAAGRAVGGFYGGVAPEARLLVVIARADGDVGYSMAHLDALTFIDRMATTLGAPVVVNVSKGMNAGAHDGKSLLEIGFDEFARGGRTPGRVVVKSSGNERVRKGHAELTVRTAQRLRWSRPPQQGAWTFERIELWWNASNALRFRLGSPGGAWSPWVTDGEPDVSGVLAPGGAFHLQLTRRHVDNGDSQLRIEIGDEKGVMPGSWTLEIVAGTVEADSTIHAWMGRGGGTPSEFENFHNEDTTITIPGTSQSVIAVAAVEAADPSFQGDFSSRGPTRDGRHKPDVSAPGVAVVAALAGTSDQTCTMQGTSMAAPHVAGAIALVLSRAVARKRDCPSANQIRSALTQKSTGYNGHFDPGQGYGIVDVAALLAAF